MTTFYSSIKVVFINLKATKFQNYLANLKGIPVINAIELDNDETISTMIAVRNLEDEDSYLVFATKMVL